jgi:hypothetical protein
MNTQNNAPLNVDKLPARLQDDGFPVTDNYEQIRVDINLNSPCTQ